MQKFFIIQLQSTTSHNKIVKEIDIINTCRN